MVSNSGLQLGPLLNDFPDNLTIYMSCFDASGRFAYYIEGYK